VPVRSILDKLLKRKATAESSANQFEAIYELAALAAAAGQFENAVRLYDQAIECKPAHAETYFKRGNALKGLGKLELAIDSYNQAIEHRPSHAHAYCNRGTVQQALGLNDAALSSYDQAIALDRMDAMAHYNRALLLQERFCWLEALASYDCAITIDPSFADAQFNRSLNLLFLGDFARGWNAYEWRWKNARRLSIAEPRNFKEPLWLGENSISGKRLLLYSEAGLGDTLQFFRYAKLCADLGATVILEVQASLFVLLTGMEEVSKLIACGQDLPPFDYQCPLMSLPLAFKTTVETVPSAPAYLLADEALIGQWRTRLGQRSRPRIGLVWSGNPQNNIDRHRSIRLADWQPHLPSEYQYFCLQRPVREEDQAILDSSPLIFSFEKEMLDFANTAALCKCLDLVISVDTSIAHLSGALGKRTWLLLPHTPDWRWMLDRTDSPWYPSMTLYRQRAAGDWNDVFNRVAAALRREFPVT
jgi:tetratricopeptide (TPR) repeat protein